MNRLEFYNQNKYELNTLFNQILDELFHKNCCMENIAHRDRFESMNCTLKAK